MMLPNSHDFEWREFNVLMDRIKRDSERDSLLLELLAREVDRISARQDWSEADIELLARAQNVLGRRL